jgi:hypothetical protein
MNRKNTREQLRLEMSQYLADFRMFGEALRRIEGWGALALILAVMTVFAVWFVTGFGFDHLNSVAGTFKIWRPRLCRPPSDLSAFILVLHAVAVTILALMALGEMMCLLDRVKRKLPTHPSYVVWPVVLMVIFSIAGFLYAGTIC